MRIFMVILCIRLLLPNCTATSFTILHTGDIHGHFSQDSKGQGGVSKIVSYIKQQRNTSTPTIYLDIGDIFTGTIWFSVHRVEMAASITKLLRVDVMCLGNHEFDEGVAGLAQYLEVTNVPMLCANADFSREAQLDPFIRPTKVLNVAGTKVGIIGYINGNTGSLSPVGKVVFEDEAKALRREIQKLKEESVNIIIALGHAGYGIDKAIAASVEDIDIIVGGHTHTYLFTGNSPVPMPPEGDYPTIIKNPKGVAVPIVHAYAFAKFVGKLSVEFDKNGVLTNFSGSPVLMDDSIPVDADVEKLLEYYTPGIDALRQQVIGTSRVYLNGSCRYYECNFGNLLMDSFIHYKTNNYRGPYWTDTAIALINGGSIRHSISPELISGNITAADLYGSIPFENILVSLEINGSTLLKAIEFSVRSDGNTSRGEFLQFSGVHVVYDFNKKPYERAQSVKVRCAQCDIPKYEPIVKEKRYRIVVNHYLASGGDGYMMLHDEAYSIVSESIKDLDILKQYINYYQILQPRNEERIIVKNDQRKVFISSARYFGISIFNLLNSIILLFVH